MRFWKYIALLLVALVYVPLSSAECNYRGEAGQISDGVDDELPKSYVLHLLETKTTPSKASLRIDKNGKAKIDLFAPFKSLKELDKATAIEIFGPISSFGEVSPCYTFHVLAPYPSGPNIFHIDMKFNKQELLANIRVRGYGIMKPEWQQIQ